MPTFETNQPIVVSIALRRAVVHLIATDRTETVVAVNPSDRNQPKDVEAADQTTVDFADGTLSVSGPKRGIAWHLVGWKRSGSVDVTVELPVGSSLRADSGFAEFRCDGRLDEVEVKTAAGDVRLDQAGALRVRTSAGQVRVEEVSGKAEIVAAGDLRIDVVGADAEVKNLNGKTWIGRVGGAVEVKAANGDIAIDDAGGDVTATTANGSIRLGQVARGEVTVETASGGLEIGIGKGTAAWLDVTTKHGRVRNDLSPAADPDPAEETVEIRGRTAFGDVQIARA